MPLAYANKMQYIFKTQHPMPDKQASVKIFPTAAVSEALSLRRMTPDTPETQNEAKFAACYTSKCYKKPPFHREREKEQERRAFSSKTAHFIGEFRVPRKQTHRAAMTDTPCRV